jgi:4a-hydroxytetrahydrobiopterin dehydratase
MPVAAKAREVGHHPDMLIARQPIRLAITTRDVDDVLTAADSGLAADIDPIAAGSAAGR